MNLIDAITDQKALHHNVFAINYVYKDEERFNLKTQISLGAIDPKKYEGDIMWFPVEHKTFMSIKMDDLLFNGQSFGFCGKNGADSCYMTPDTGLTYIVMPAGLMPTLQ